MTIDQLRELVRDARWCAALGTGPEAGALHIENGDEWRKLILECEAEEFGLEPQAPSRVPDFRWLSEDVQIRLPLPSAHLEIRRLVAASTRHLGSSWLVVDRTDLTPAFRRAASAPARATAERVEFVAEAGRRRIQKLLRHGPLHADVRPPAGGES